MQDKMSLLRDLQEIDQEINSIEALRAGFQQELGEFEAQAGDVQAMLDQLGEEIGQLREEEAQLQQELLKQRDNVTRVEARLPGIQTQKEYVAVLKEIDMAKKGNRELEEQLSVKQQEIASLVEDLKEKEAALAAISATATARGTELQQQLDDSGAKLDKQMQVRETVVADVPPALLRKYQGLFKRRNGLALAIARNGACLGCNMQLPPQQYNRLLRGGDLQTCPHCNRILYVEEEA
ncbi:MAG: C4-type zinc ribbon domain-containing protein [Pelovirga sp.]